MHCGIRHCGQHVNACFLNRFLNYCNCATLANLASYQQFLWYSARVSTRCIETIEVMGIHESQQSLTQEITGAIRGGTRQDADLVDRLIHLTQTTTHVTWTVAISKPE